MWHWCKKHKQQEVYDGLYITHRPEDHDAWVDRKKNWNTKKKPSYTASSGDASATSKLTLSNNLKAVMITNFQCTLE